MKEKPTYEELEKENNILRQKIEKDEKFKSFFENSKAIMLQIHPITKKIIDANIAALDFYGYTKKQLLKKTIYELNLLSNEKINQKMSKAIVEKSGYFEFKHKLANNEIRNVEVYSSTFSAKDGEQILFIIVYDITNLRISEHKILERNRELLASEEELRAINEELIIAKQEAENSKENFRMITQSTLDVIFIIDKFGKMIFFNEQLQDILGYEPNNVIGKSFTEFVPKKEIPKYLLKLKDVFLKKKVKIFVTKIIHKSGKLVDVEINGKLTKYNGKTVAQGTIRDITERLKNERELQKSESMFNSIFNSNPYPMHLVNSEFEIIATNSKLLDLKELEFEDIKGEKCYEVYQNNKEICDNCAVEYVFETKKNYRLESQIILPDNSIKYFETYAYPILDNDDNIIYAVETTIDITDKKIIEKKLIENEKLLKEAQKIAKLGHWKLDLVKNELVWSDEMYRIFDVKQHEFKVTYEDFLDKIHPDDRNKVNDAYLGALKTKLPYEIEHRLLLKTGELKYVVEKCITEFDEQGKPLQSIGTILDITNQKQIELALKNQNEEYYALNEEYKVQNEELFKAKKASEKSEEWFRAISEQAVEGITIADVEGRYVFVNPAFCKMTGYDKEELLKITIFDLLSNRKGVAIDPELFGVPTEFTLKRKDNSIFPIQIVVNPIKIDNKDLFLAIIADFTEQKEIEEALLKSEAHYRQLFDSLPYGGEIIDKDGRIVNCSNATLTMLGYEKEELIGEHIIKFIDEKYINVYKKNFPKILKGEKLFLEVTLVHKSGRKINVLRAGQPIYNIKNEEEGVLAISVDITERKKAEKELLKQNKEYCSLTEEYQTQNAELILAKEKAEESNNLKTEFINNMSHEIRTPMNGILGFSDFLLEDELSNEKRKQFATIIQNSGKQLMRIIDDILEISKLGTKQVTAIESELVLNDLLLELFSIFDIKAKENKTPLYLKNELSDEESIIYSDELKLNKIISNLLENALKFTNNGYIELGYNIIFGKDIVANNLSMDIDDDDAFLQIYVKDTGIGIAEDKQEIIFERFSQENKEISKKVGGLGLGLSIAKENTELLGGKITLVSEKEKGTTFFVTIPYKPVKSNIHKKNNINETNDIQNVLEENIVLIVEDEEVNFLYLDTLFKKSALNIKRLHAKNGQEAVDICKRNSKINLVLMDLKMPVMNGFEATKIIKGFRPNLKIIAQTAFSTSTDEYKAISSGCDDFYSKPLSEKSFNDMMDKYMTKT